MKKNIMISIITIIYIIFIVLFFLFNTSNNAQEPEQIYTTNKVISGEVTEIINESKIKIVITKERGGHRKGDVIFIEYKDVNIEIINEEETQNANIDINIGVGDTVSAKINENYVREEGYNCYTIDEIVKVIY